MVFFSLGHCRFIHPAGLSGKYYQTYRPRKGDSNRTPACFGYCCQNSRFSSANKNTESPCRHSRLAHVGLHSGLHGKLNIIVDALLSSFLPSSQVIVGSSTLSYFYPTLVKGLGYTTDVSAQYMTVPIYGVAFVCTAISGYFCDRIPHHRGLVIASWLTISLITSVVVCTVYDFTVRYAMLVIMAAGLWASNALALSFASSTFGDMEAETRAVALALVNAMGNLAQIYGSYLFPSNDAPKYLMGFGVISALLGVGIVTYILMNVFVKRTKS